MDQPNTTGASDAARGMMDRVRDTASAQLTTQKDRATEALGGIAQAVRQTTQPFRDQRQDTIAGYIDRAADQIDKVSTHLREHDVKDLLDDAQRFAKRQPAVFIGAAFAIGVIAARFLKSSAPERDNRQSDGPQSYSPQWQQYGRTAPAMGGGPRNAGGL